MNLSFKISIILSETAITISLPSDAASLGAITLSLNNRWLAIIKTWLMQDLTQDYPEMKDGKTGYQKDIDGEK